MLNDAGEEITCSIPVVDVHELLDHLHEEMQVQCPQDAVKFFWQHLRENGNEHAQNLGTDEHIPFSLYGDEACLTMGDPKDKVTGIYLTLTLFRPKCMRESLFLLCAIQDKYMVHDQLRTLLPILRHITWSSNIAYDGRWPTCDASGKRFDSSSRKAKLAGQAMAARFACSELRGDWKWFERTLRLHHTPTSTRFCFLCLAEAQDNPMRYYDLGDQAPWVGSEVNTATFLVDVLRKQGPLRLSVLDKFQSLQALISAGVFGDPSTESLKDIMAKAFLNFKSWKRRVRIPCSQKAFAPGSLLKKQHGYYLTCKAYNGRVVLIWLTQLCADASRGAPADSVLPLHDRALPLVRPL
ncbi:unnamed protein product [Symbiodinium natans]|uniref:Uncharacterized protein n=1 Tax=Symbiodinium natans TaxID=878477 RepID=A0A812UNJ7_9DINO|nr:unnamed protein product [Symbiodinium natans]